MEFDNNTLIRPQKERVIVFDVMRILAISLVVLLHTVSPIVGGAVVDSSSFVIANILNGLSRIGVPLFFMISGALMLNETKELSVRKILTKYVKNIVLLLTCWSFLYACLYEIIVPALINKTEVSFNAFLMAIINGATHLWFLFVIIGLYLITPFLRSFVKKDNKGIVLYFIILATIFCLFPKTADAIIRFWKPDWNFFGKYFAKFSMGFVLDCTIYYLLGWYIVNFSISKKKRITIYTLGILSLIYTILSVQLFSSNGHYIGGDIHNNLTLNISLYAVAVFIFLWTKYKDYDFSKTRNVIERLSELSFGVYLIHIAVLYLISHFLIGQHIVIRISVTWIGGLLFSYGIAFVMSKIPLIRKLIRA